MNFQYTNHSHSELNISTIAFASTEKEGLVSGGLRRAGTVVRNPLDAKKDRVKKAGGKLKPSEVCFPHILDLKFYFLTKCRFLTPFLNN